MSKLSLDALKERAEVTASTELLATISGGTANSCHSKEKSFWDHVSDFFGSLGQGGVGAVGTYH